MTLPNGAGGGESLSDAAQQAKARRLLLSSCLPMTMHAGKHPRHPAARAPHPEERAWAAAPSGSD